MSSTIDDDIILLLIGTNNIAMLEPAERALNKLNILINNICELKPESHLFLSSIPPINDYYINKTVQDYNSRIKILCEKHKNSKIYFVDVYKALSIHDLFDGAHPNESGHRKIAFTWYEAILLSQSVHSQLPQVMLLYYSNHF